MAEIDRSWIGGWSEPFEVEVEKGAIRRFADAIGDPNPLYRDEAAARRLGHAGVIAPPTFATCFRPPADPPWIVPLDRRRIVAGEIAFESLRPIVAGMRLTCRVQLEGVQDKAGSKGPMQLLQQALHGQDEHGEPVFVMRRTTVYRPAGAVGGSQGT